MASYETIYPGVEYSSLMPSSYVGPVSYQSPVSELGMAIDPRTANQLGEINLKINPGVETIEVQGTFAHIFESVPEKHLDEIRRLMKLTGVKPTLHGPMLEPSGIGEQGYLEENRIGVEKQMESAILRAHKLDPEGNIPVTFHSTAKLPEFRPHLIVDRKDGKPVIEEQGMWVIDDFTGNMNFIKPSKRYFPEEGKFTGEIFKFEAGKELERVNEESWSQNLSELTYYADRGENILNELRKEFPDKILSQLGKIDPNNINDEQLRIQFKEAQRAVTHGQIFLRNSYRSMKQLFDRAYNVILNEEDKRKLEEYAIEVTQKVTPGIERDFDKLNDLKDVVEKGLRTLSNLKEPPKMIKVLNEFAIDKSAQTFANIAESAFNKYGNKSPIVSIENPPAGGGLSRAEDLKELIETSRKKFVENLVQHKGLSISEANGIAEQMIGATWDVGHINMLRKKGYTEKDIIEQTKLIAPFVKHVHLSDNFGLDHTELPMGMGNVPLKPMLEELKKAGFKGQKIIEAGNWWEFFAQQGGGNPFWPSIEAFDSPIYSSSYGPTWGQGGRYGTFYLGQGPISPPKHHELYGAGFSNLPVELGGEIPGDRSRFAGTPNQ